MTPGITVADVDASATTATSLGGVVTTGQPVDVPGIGRMARILGPGPSIFVAISPAAGAPGTYRPGGSAPGGWAWDRLQAQDVSAAVAFYRDVVGWTVTTDASTATIDAPDGTRVAEIVAAEGAPGWLPFVEVDDLAASLDRADRLGGSVVADPAEATGVGTYAVLADPEGATLAVVERRG